MSNIHVIIINNSRGKDKRNMSASVVVIQNPPDLHKLFVRLSQPKSFNIFRIFDEYERLHVSHWEARVAKRCLSPL